MHCRFLQCKIIHNYVLLLLAPIIVSCGILYTDTSVSATNNLVGWWKFDEGSGSVALDVSGNGYDGSIANATYSTNIPATNFVNTHSLDFNNGVVSTGLSLNNFSAFTVAGWARPTAAGSRLGWFGQNDVLEFGFSDSDTIVCYTAAGEIMWDFTSETLPMNQWHHITCIADGTNIILYINGESVASSPAATNNYGASGNTFSIGGGVLDASGGHFQGRIDDVRVYNYALTPDEMEGLGTGESGPTNNPTISSFSPTDNATGIALSANLVATFSTSTIATSTGSIALYQVSDDSLVESIPVASSQISKSGAIITINPSVTLEELTQYYVSIPSTAFKDAADAFYEGTVASTTWSFTTGDFTSPAIAMLSPADNATGVALTSDLVLTLDEAVDAETGNISIYKSSDDSLVEAIDVTSGQVTGSGTTIITINPAADFEYGTSYYIQIAATAFDDATGNSFAGISDATTWNFTTIAATPAPEASSGSRTGSSVATRVKNLINMGKEAAANELIDQWPHLFSETTLAQIDSASTVSQAPLITAVPIDLTPTPVRDLYITLSGEDVKKLQTLLITLDRGPMARELARISATGYFGTYTRDALAEYQKLNSISPSQGYFGPITRVQMKRTDLRDLWW